MKLCKDKACGKPVEDERYDLCDECAEIAYQDHMDDLAEQAYMYPPESVLIAVYNSHYNRNYL